MLICKGAKVKVMIRQHNPRKGKIVYIFKALQIPKKKKVIKYYGKMIINPKYASIFGPMKCARIVVKSKKHGYTVLPLHGLGTHFQLEEL